MDDIPLHHIPNEDLIVDLPYELKGKFSQVNFTGHALLRMKERRISQEEVLEVLQNPHGMQDMPDQPKRTREFINQKHDQLHVVWEPEPGYSHRMAVITVIRKQKKPAIRRRRR